MTIEFEQMWACPCSPTLPIPLSQACSGCDMTFAELQRNWPTECPSMTEAEVHGHRHHDPAWARVMGACGTRPCACANTLVSGCTCEFYLCSIRRRIGHHFTDCKIFEKGMP